MKTFHRLHRARGILFSCFPLRPLRPSFAISAVKSSAVDPIWTDPEFVSRKQTLRPWL